MLHGMDKLEARKPSSEFQKHNRKQSIRASSPARSVDDLNRKINCHMGMLKKKPEHVKKYLQNRYVAYAV
ncbi:hypothetical protein [Marinobacterium rhizophilum]|uniref:Uncharacterized protein n=1 Tax=Marinobacterium rhizophilum TaxID=420402 RepID=A0ABY5HI66_9GAMM|nr:hypothetical protein [Marinobacterium rhizophilum]UTW11527.1 hypothetical protein KDW95_20090 [Marinobacterium rhizophilum]